jgi:hypothetical protein
MTDFERIAASAPINATAARQLSPGEAYTPAVTIRDYWQDMPPLKTAAQLNQSARRNPMWRDFTGMTFGRLTVLGVMVKDGNGPASWVCRCKCGGFCSRTSKSLKVAERGGNSFVDRCGMCDYLNDLRNGKAPAKPAATHRLKSAGRVAIEPKGKWG